MPEEEKKEEKKGTLPEDVQKEFLAASKKAGTKDVAERAAELEGKIPTKKKEEYRLLYIRFYPVIFFIFRFSSFLCAFSEVNVIFRANRFYTAIWNFLAP